MSHNRSPHARWQGAPIAGCESRLRQDEPQPSRGAAEKAQVEPSFRPTRADANRPQRSLGDDSVTEALFTTQTWVPSEVMASGLLNSSR